MDNLTENQRNVFLKIKEFLSQKMDISDNQRWSDWSILRFCRARNFDIDKVKLMISDNADWGRLVKIDSIGSIDNKLIEGVRGLTEHGYYNTDKTGRPVYIEKISGLKADDIFKRFTEEELVLYYVQSYERLLHIILPESSRMAGRRVDSTLTIMDLEGVNVVTLFTGKVKAFTTLTTKIAQDNYPEIMGNLVIVNSGFLFKGIYAIYSVTLDVKTKKKVIIHSGSGKKDLLSMIDEEKLPKFLGGKCESDVKSNVGPWKEELELSYRENTVFHSNRFLYKQFYPNLNN